MYDSYSTPARLGTDYEKYVAGYFIQNYDCTVIHQGLIRGKRDGGIDLIAFNDDVIYLVQCKYHSSATQIHSNYVSQLHGDTDYFKSCTPTAKKIIPVLVAHCSFASDAIQYAYRLNVDLLRLPYQPVAVPYMTDKNYISSVDGDYLSAVRAMLSSRQPVAAGRHSAPEPVQRPAPVPSQTIPAADQTTPEPNRPTSPAASSTPPYKSDPDAPVFRDPERDLWTNAKAKYSSDVSPCQPDKNEQPHKRSNKANSDIFNNTGCCAFFALLAVLGIVGSLHYAWFIDMKDDLTFMEFWDEYLGVGLAGSFVGLPLAVAFVCSVVRREILKFKSPDLCFRSFGVEFLCIITTMLAFIPFFITCNNELYPLLENILYFVSGLSFVASIYLWCGLATGLEL